MYSPEPAEELGFQDHRLIVLSGQQCALTMAPTKRGLFGRRGSVQPSDAQALCKWAGRPAAVGAWDPERGVVIGVSVPCPIYPGRGLTQWTHTDGRGQSEWCSQLSLGEATWNCSHLELKPLGAEATLN